MSTSRAAVISIDIGEKNLGWTYALLAQSTANTALAQSKRDFRALELKDIEFEAGVYDYKMKRGVEVVKSRVSSLTEFFKRFDLSILKLAIIERQVPGNHVACELMYAVTAILYQYTDNIVIFDPKLKFTHIGQTYDTKNKKHKKQSILNMNRMLATNESASFARLKSTLDAAAKKDDIADSFNQLIIELNIEGIITRDLRPIYNKDELEDEASKPLSKPSFKSSEHSGVEASSLKSLSFKFEADDEELSD